MATLKYEIGINLVYAHENKQWYMAVNQYYFFPKSKSGGDISVLFKDISEEDANSIITKLNLKKRDDSREGHTNYDCALRTKLHKYNMEAINNLKKRNS